MLGCRTRRSGQLLACWLSEIGTLNQIVLPLRPRGSAARRPRHDPSKGGPFDIGEFPTSMTQRTDTFPPALFSPLR